MRIGLAPLGADRWPEVERIHQTAGFRVVGIRERLSQMAHGPLAGQWRDVVFVERRSTVVGR